MAEQPLLWCPYCERDGWDVKLVPAPHLTGIEPQWQCPNCEWTGPANEGIADELANKPPVSGRLEPIDAMAKVLEFYCRNPDDAHLAAKECCDALCAYGYTLEDRLDELKAAGIEVPWHE